MRYLAIDLGDKRTGFAAGDDVVGLVQPLSVVEAPTRALQVKASLRAIDEYGPDRIVVGLPFNMDGTEGPRAKLVREALVDVFAWRQGVFAFVPQSLTVPVVHPRVDLAELVRREQSRARPSFPPPDPTRTSSDPNRRGRR